MKGGARLGNTPGFPYDSWALAANSVKTGAQAVAYGGTMVIASGTYDPNPGSGLLWNSFPDRRAVLRAVESESDPSPGRVTLARNGFGSGYKNTDPDRFNVTLAYGTFTFATNASGQCFLEYTVSGSQTVLDNSGAEFYVGMTCYNTTLHVTDHARSQAWRVYAGGVNGRGAKILIDSSAALTTSGNFYLANGAKDITVTVSNATLQADSVAVYPSSMSSNIWLNVVDDGVLSLTGTAKTFSPFTVLTVESGVVFDDTTFDQSDVAFNFTTGTNNTLIVRDGADVNVKSLTMGASGQETGFVCLVDNAALAMPNACTLNGDAKLRLDVSKAAFNGTAPTFVSAGTLTVGSDASVELTGVAELKARAEAADVRRCKVTLLNAAEGLDISDAAVQAMSESLPEGTVLQRTSTALKLRIGPPQGFVLSFR